MGEGPARLTAATEPRLFGIPSARKVGWALALWLLAPALAGAGVATNTPETKLPQSPQDYYNDGTRKLKAAQLREAEFSLKTALASNHESLQPAALYNLGHVRFRQGVEALKDSGNLQTERTRGDNACTVGDQAIAQADAALAGSDLRALIAAYQNGRGARKELKAATAAVKRALETYGAVLSRWQRSSGDFKSAHELQPTHADAQFNATWVDRRIAELIDQQQLMQKTAQCAGDKKEGLRQRMAALKQRLPEGMKQDGDEDDEEEEDDERKGPKPGQEEAPPRTGHEMWLTPEEAARLLQAMQLDANRKLPMGADPSEKPRDRKGRDW